MDVKSGNGAFLTDPDQARKLADNIIRVAGDAGVPATALLTDMNQPLASSAGNALELREALNWLRGASPNPRLEAVTLALAGELLLLGDLASDIEAAQKQLRQALDSGAAAERFSRMVGMQGGPADLMDDPDRYLTPAPIVMDVPAPHSGHVAAIDVRALGTVVVMLGGGRLRVEDTIDPRVGLDALSQIGDRRASGEPLARVHADSRGAADSAITALQAAIRLSDEPVPPQPAVLGRIEN
jgi:thymidine phosphorylase